MNRLYTDHICIKCLLDKYADTSKMDVSDENKTLYLKALLRLIAETPTTVTAPDMIETITALQESFGIKGFDYASVKNQYNDLLLSLEDSFWEEIVSSEDPLDMAMRYAFTGNYIDFGALSDITEEKLHGMLAEVKNVPLDQREIECFKKDMNGCKNLVYLTDNCGEIVFDKLFIRLLNRLYSKASVKVIVRGFDVLNDATRFDAEKVGLDKIVPVISNGSGVAGTVLDKISKESRHHIDEADVIIAKGMGNFETLKGSGLNIYYMFLCKCEKFCSMFKVPRFTYMLVNEKRCRTKKS